MYSSFLETSFNMACDIEVSVIIPTYNRRDLLPRALERQVELFESALREGTRLVAIDFPVPGWTEAARREVGPLKQPVRLYVVGEHRRTVKDAAKA